MGTLSELFVEHDYALSRPASQSTTLTGFAHLFGSVSAASAVDGDMSTFSHTREISNQWWKVTLDNIILLSKVYIYARDDGCSGGPCCK